MRLGTTLALLLALIAAAIVALWPYVRVASFVVRAAHLGGWLERAAGTITVPIEEKTVEIPTRYGPIRARVYRPVRPPGRASLLVTGIHAAGIDEPRLMRLAREAAATGWAIVTPEVPDLTAYKITSQSTDVIEDAGVWLAGRQDLAADGRIGLMGVSFSGGLSIVAAGRPSLRDRARFILSFGGHGDLPRVLQYFCTGQEPAADGGAARAPHDYGLAVVAFGVAERLVPADQVAPFREALRVFLDASGVASVDPEQAEAGFQRAHALERNLPEPAASVMHHVNGRDVRALGALLLPEIGDFGTDPALSPERSAPPTAPVFLLHGADDNVIPAAESRLLARWLAGKTEVHTYFSRPISHASVDTPATLADYWGLIAFWRGLLR